MNATDSKVPEFRGFIPQFIIERDRYAEKSGLTAASAICRDKEGDFVIETRWHGPEAAFRAVGLLRPRQPAPVGVKRGGMEIRKPWADGTLRRLEDGSLSFVAVAEVPLSIDASGDGVERIDFGPDDWRHQSRVAFHGTEQALRAAGLATFTAAPWEKGSRYGKGWKADLQPDGQVVFWSLKEQPRESTAEASPQPVRHLKLVVNNTQRSADVEPGPFAPRPAA